MKTAPQKLLWIAFVGIVASLAVLAACSTDNPTAPAQPAPPPPGSPTADVTVVVAAFDCTTQTGTLTIVCTNSSTGEPTLYSWDFGDGTSSSAIDPVHTYALEGVYVVTLTVADSISTDSLAQFVSVGETPANVTADFAFQATNLTVTFDNNSGGNPEPDDFLWDFGDGRTSSARNPIHTYRREGTYVVTLSASNGLSSATVDKIITVDDGISEPKADFTFVTNGLTVIFTDASTGADDYLWDFGDATTSTVKEPVHTYAAGGTYVVTLTVTNKVGSDSVSKFVTVP